MNKIFIIQEKITNLIYPQTCGICGKIATKSICPKCNRELKKQAEINILTKNEIESKYFSELIYIFKYEGQIRQLIIDYKFNEKSYMYKTFVNFLLNNKKIFENIKKYDKIIPVPISKKRYKERGYNQSLLIAKEIVRQISKSILETDIKISKKQSNLELVNNCLIKTKNIVEQSKLNKEDRQQNIKGVYSIQNKKIITNKKILLIDDIYTTGSTVNECSRILQQANPKKIGVLVLAKD